jgi:hypothetical protein
MYPVLICINYVYQLCVSIMCYVTQVTHRSRDRELGQEGMCNKVRDRYEEGCAHSCASQRARADAVASYANGIKGVTCDYKSKRIKSKYSKKAYTGLTAMRDLSQLLSTIVT